VSRFASNISISAVLLECEKINNVGYGYRAASSVLAPSQCDCFEQSNI
jgi:hypothetical protein